MNKGQLRKKCLEQRLALSKEECTQRSESITQQFFENTDLSDVKYLHVFLPIEKFNEVDTWLIIDRIKGEYPDVNIVVPKVIGNDLEHYLYEGKEQLKDSKWGVPEPQYGNLVSPELIDIVLIPLVVADWEGNRIGYGKGYYDRLLKQCRFGVKKIGLSLLPLSEEAIDAEEQDVRLDVVIISNRKSFR